MSKQGSSFKEALQNVFAVSAIVIAFVVSYLLFVNVMGNPVNFEGGNPKGHALQGNYLGIIYKGGFIVPILMTCVLVLIIFVVERLITLSRVKGKGRLNVFVHKLQTLLAEDKIEEALEACDKQKGSLANVMKAGLLSIVTFSKIKSFQKTRKSIQSRDHMRSPGTQLPMLSKNMIVFSTLASISVLIGLIGTVLGMIRAFGALAQSGAPDALALSQVFQKLL